MNLFVFVRYRQPTRSTSTDTDFPYPTLVRSTRRGAIMNSAVFGIEFCAKHDAIEPGHGPPRRETFAAVREMEMMCEVAETASLSAPLVQIAHQDGGHASLLPCVCDDGRCLPTPP